MANPNIVNVATILANVRSLLFTTSSSPFAVPIVSNPANSNTVIKVNMLMVSSLDPTNAREMTVRIHPTADPSSSAGNTIIANVNIPAKASLVVLDKSTSIYLLEDQSLSGTANTANLLSVTCSWEEIR